MPFDPHRRLFASTSFRLALLCAAVTATSFAFAAVGAWVVSKASAEQVSRERVQEEMVFLQEHIRRHGMAAAIEEIAERQAGHGLYYQIISADGVSRVGDLPLADAPPGWSINYLESHALGAASPDLAILNEAMPDGGRLVIGEDLERTEGARYAVLRTLLWFGFGGLVLSLMAGYLAARGGLRRMDALIATMEKVNSGDLAARVPARGSPRGNDIDLLGRRINDMLGRVDALVADVRRVSADIAHDLRTPLSNVMHDLEAAAAAASGDAGAAVRSAQQRIEGVLRTFDAMLRLAEIDAGAGRSRFTQVDLGEIVERVADAYRPDVESVGGTLNVEALPGLAVDGDRDMLAQALANLIENAMKHSGAQPRIKILAGRAGENLTLIVEDRGDGIPEAYRQEVLKPLARLDASRTVDGAGLGLSIVAAVAKLHRAALLLEDAEPGLRVRFLWSRASQIAMA